jgi:hypothetical protein
VKLMHAEVFDAGAVIARYQIQAPPVIARLWRDKRSSREAGSVRGLCAETEVDGYLRTPAAGAAYILTLQLDDELANWSPSASETTTTTSAGSPATTSTKWCSTRRPRLPHREPRPHPLQSPTQPTTRQEQCHD